MTARKDTRGSTEKLQTRSDYERGKLDGLAEAVALIRERASAVEKDAKVDGEVSSPRKLYEIGARNEVADELWLIYKRRVI